VCVGIQLPYRRHPDIVTFFFFPSPGALRNSRTKAFPLLETPSSGGRTDLLPFSFIPPLADFSCRKSPFNSSWCQYPSHPVSFNPRALSSAFCRLYQNSTANHGFQLNASTEHLDAGNALPPPPHSAATGKPYFFTQPDAYTFRGRQAPAITVPVGAPCHLNLNCSSLRKTSPSLFMGLPPNGWSLVSQIFPSSFFARPHFPHIVKDDLLIQ